jgi:hypothetical protein
VPFQSFCNTCPYYAIREELSFGANERHWHAGECRKNAPYGQGAPFPQVSAIDWCGDHPENNFSAELLVMEPEDEDNYTLTRCGKRALYGRF